MGKALVVKIRETSIFPVPIHPQQVELEVERFRHALGGAKKQLQGIRERVRKEIGESYAGVFDAQLLILEDGSLVDETIRRIRDEGVNAEWVFRNVTDQFIERFEKVADPYLRERGGDLEDAHRRVQAALRGAPHHHDLSELTEDVIIVAPELTPSETALLHREHVIGFITDGGGPTSHTAILAEALGIPAVVGMHDFTHKVSSGDLLLINAVEGSVVHKPTEEQLHEHRERQLRFRDWTEEIGKTRDQPAVTEDGAEVHLMANIELPEEMDSALDQGAKGVGLYRSEFLFLEKSPELPSEDDHYRVCRILKEKSAPHGAIIRTLDLGGEKYYHSVLEGNEANPVMGLRAIRFCLRRKDIFRTQLRGILRASTGGGLQLMFPMISSVQELRQAREVLDEVRDELRGEGVPFDESLAVGIMVEIPSAAATADLLAREADFFSIGTNDLIQYCLAIDRSNESVAYLYEPFHPAVLRMLNFVIESAHKAGIGVSMCGEMAGNPLSLALLLGMGLRDLSMHPVSIPRIRATIRRLNIEECKEILARVLQMTTGREIDRFVRERIGERVPEDFPVRSS
jgi:phosphotransferase system enzyme I (PtsI)